MIRFLVPDFINVGKNKSESLKQQNEAGKKGGGTVFLQFTRQRADRE